MASTLHGQVKRPEHKPQSTGQSFDLSAAIGSVVSVVVYDKDGKPVGQGSGFFVDKEGKVVTNWHVIKNASGAVIKFSNGTLYSAMGILATDEDNDLAVLKVEGKNFSTLPLANSDTVKVGDKVVAIGSPLGLEETVSDGLISGIRDVGGARIFQTTASISPGSSGGALLNAQGQVVAVTAFQLTSGQNLNFAIPVNYIKPLLVAHVAAPFTPSNAPISSTTSGPPKPTPPSPSLPKYWTNLLDGSSVEVRVDGDFIYEMSEQHVKDGPYSVQINCICELRRRDDRWVGKCRWRYDVQDAARTRLCMLETDEVVTSVSPTRIEGEGQTIEAGRESQFCPRAGISKEQFSLIPRD